MPRVILIVMDGVGVGGLPDAPEYGDAGANTLSSISKTVGGLSLPCLQSLGLGLTGEFEGIIKVKKPLASYGVMRELSKGKDTITGHWEMAGVVSEKPFPTYPRGFPPEVIGEFEQRTGRKVIGNRPASGTEIIKELGGLHMKTGALIVYTSADSVFQIAAHEDVVSVEELYEICKKAREILVGPRNVCRVIARPFTGASPVDFRRTERRRDFALPPPETTVLDVLKENSIPVAAVGKVSDMFSGRGFSSTVKSSGNSDSMAKIISGLSSLKNGLIFSNLTDFDTLYGHRNDPSGFARALREFDSELSGLIPLLGVEDFLILTADHGNDPTTPGTDHTREYVPLLFYNTGLRPKDLGIRDGLWDIGATIADVFGVRFGKGKSFL